MFNVNRYNGGSLLFYVIFLLSLYRFESVYTVHYAKINNNQISDKIFVVNVYANPCFLTIISVL